MDPTIIISNIPWAQIAKYAPTVLTKAKALFSRSKPEKIDPNTIKIAELAEIIQKLDVKLNEQAAIIEQLAMQNQAQFIRIEKNTHILVGVIITFIVLFIICISVVALK